MILLKLKQSLYGLILLWLTTSFASANTNASLKLLQEMVQAGKKQNYEMSFIKLYPDEEMALSLSYTHAQENGIDYGNVLYLDGIKKEIIQHDNLVSYLDINGQAFSLESELILDFFPSVLYADFDKLKKYYYFSDMGKSRVANRTAHVIKIIGKEDLRHHYLVWIDADTKLLLRSDLLTMDGRLLQQFRVVNLNLGYEANEFISKIKNLNLFNSVFINKEQEQSLYSELPVWELTWLPIGFKEINTKIIDQNLNEPVIESKLYSDGLFSFSLYVADTNNNPKEDMFVQQNQNIIYTQNIGNKNITLIGDIPLATAQRIVNSFKPSSK